MLNEGYKVKPITEVNFNFVPIKTVGLPWLQKIKAWLTTSRRMVLTEDWFARLPNGDTVWIPRGFITDGSSIPRPLRFIAQAIGITLTAGVLHDWLYCHRCFLNPDGSFYKGTFKNREEVTRFEADYIFKIVNFNINDMIILSSMMYFALRGFGWIAWNQHRGNDGTMKNNVKKYLPKEDAEP